MYPVISGICALTTTIGSYLLTESSSHVAPPGFCDPFDQSIPSYRRRKICEALAGEVLRVVGSLFSGATMGRLVFEWLSETEVSMGLFPPLAGLVIAVF